MSTKLKNACMSAATIKVLKAKGFAVVSTNYDSMMVVPIPEGWEQVVKGKLQVGDMLWYRKAGVMKTTRWFKVDADKKQTCNDWDLVLRKVESKPKREPEPVKEPGYVYWSPGDKKPDTLPEGCELWDPCNGWCTSHWDPKDWDYNNRRWPAPKAKAKRKWVYSENNPVPGVFFKENLVGSSMSCCVQCCFRTPRGYGVKCSAPECVFKVCPTSCRKDRKSGFWVKKVKK